MSGKTGQPHDILDLLAVSTGVVAVSRIDTVDRARLEAVCAAVAERLDGTSLQHAPIVPVSAVTGEGMDELERTLVAVLGRRRWPPPGPPRLWVDRSFVARGAGTIVTGTLVGGSLRPGDEVQILPREMAGRVRTIQSLKRTFRLADLAIALR